MSESQTILNRISALKEKLTHAAEGTSEPKNPRSVEALEKRIKAGSQFDGLLDSVLRQLPADTPLVRLPAQLTSRAHRLLETGKDLLHQLRGLADVFAEMPEPPDVVEVWYTKTVSLANVALRAIGTFPDAPSAQLQLCEGIEALLQVVAERLGRLNLLVERSRKENGWIDALVEIFRALEANQVVDWNRLTEVAQAIDGEFRDGLPVRFLHCTKNSPERHVACHGLNVAQVIARVLRNDPALARRPLEAISAGLLHDVGMIACSPEVWMSATTFDDSQRQQIEPHARLGAELMARSLPDKTWLAEVVGDHHERLDGTGYPGGLRTNQISWLPRLLAACDVYVALRSKRPYRVERNSRTALTEVLALAETGALDRHAAERLLGFTLYPPGTVVELADGSVAAVIAAPVHRGDLKATLRPVVALLADYQGKCLPFPQHLDLGATEGRSIVRSLTGAERLNLLAEHYPEVV